MHLEGMVIRLRPYQGYRLLATCPRHRLVRFGQHTCSCIVAGRMTHHRFAVLVRTPFGLGQHETSMMSRLPLTNDSWRSGQRQLLAIVVVTQWDKTMMKSKLHVTGMQKQDPGDSTSTHTTIPCESILPDGFAEMVP